ncbi:response regulator [Paenibacillus sp. R14(2021)]|uniref:response regulator transcription factor n=1 Tax=Paenibacillus sp. R14(2021) TaxID=2859228 RepID=UPI001C61385F|nr:response regulator [Paenibacillus sp. R14(2021)]
MLTIFLVEDETIELNLMVNHMNWADMGIEVIGSAKNGKKAWEQIQVLQPDIVLSDVRMPFMDGLQLASLIQERYDWIKVVFLSGHDEFTYVKSALHTGAVGYLLKPIDRRELSAVMAKVKAEVEKAKLLRRSKEMLIENQVETLLTAEDGGSREQAWLELTGMYPAYTDLKFVIALINLDGYAARRAVDPQAGQEAVRITSLLKELLEVRRVEGTVIRLQEQEWLLALPCAAEGDGYAFLWEETARTVELASALTATIGVCDKANTLQEGRSMYETARRAVRERFLLGPGHVVLASKLRDRLDLELSGEERAQSGRLDRLDLSDREGAGEAVRHYYDVMIRLRAAEAHVRQGTGELLRAIDTEYAKYEDRAGLRAVGERSDWQKAVERAESIGEIRDITLDMVNRICIHIESRQQDHHMLLVQQVMDIIDNEYFDSLTIDYLAGKVYLSPNYLRVLFKEKKGCTIHEYLTAIRLNKSLELLRDRTLKIHEVARKVGYDNTSYFCSFFYKTQGVTPNEYRKKFL